MSEQTEQTKRERFAGWFDTPAMDRARQRAADEDRSVSQVMRRAVDRGLDQFDADDAAQGRP